MITPDALRAHLVADPDSRGSFSAAIPTYRQMKLIEYIKRRPKSTSAEVANALKVTVPCASTQLSRLVDLGWLTRTDEGDPTGGKQYAYHINPKLTNRGKSKC